MTASTPGPPITPLLNPESQEEKSPSSHSAMLEAASPTGLHRGWGLVISTAVVLPVQQTRFARKVVLLDTTAVLGELGWKTYPINGRLRPGLTAPGLRPLCSKRAGGALCAYVAHSNQPVEMRQLSGGPVERMLRRSGLAARRAFISATGRVRSEFRWRRKRSLAVLGHAFPPATLAPVAVRSCAEIDRPRAKPHQTNVSRKTL
ncbi:hypothetical protein COCON_G00198900 [Conger conger]|uniref:Uncharacterized protein n=1 Tax=Conger conger TaxID=82655 RepID=A0A9Q1D1D8_CONCO|nr:hypothetical protein COCON_G00198900 [Conger conger]